MAHINELVTDLRSARWETDGLKERILETEERLQNTPEYTELQYLKQKLAEHQLKVDEIDQQLRNLALAAYERNRNRKPHEKIKIAITKSLTYPEDRAIRWAIAHEALDMVKLDKRKFEKQARTLDDTALAIDFVKVEEKPQVRIAKEL